MGVQSRHSHSLTYCYNKSAPRLYLPYSHRSPHLVYTDFPALSFAIHLLHPQSTLSNNHRFAPAPLYMPETRHLHFCLSSPPPPDDWPGKLPLFSHPDAADLLLQTSHTLRLPALHPPVRPQAHCKTHFRPFSDPDPFY